MTILLHTGRADFFFEASLIFLQRNGASIPVSMKTREGYRRFSLSGMPIHFQSCLLKGLLPQGILELIAPAIKTASPLKGFH